MLSEENRIPIEIHAQKLRPIAGRVLRRYFPEVATILRKRVRSEFQNWHLMHRILLPTDILVEAGANIGNGTNVFRNRVAVVHAFEPNPICFNLLKKRAEKWKNVHVYNIGLSNKEGQVSLGISGGPLFQGSSIEEMGSKSHNKRYTVNVQPLDAFKLNPTIVVFDMEGHETRALEGSRQTLRGVRALFVETHLTGVNTEKEVLEFLLPNGFDIQDIGESHPDRWIIATKRNILA